MPTFQHPCCYCLGPKHCALTILLMNEPLTGLPEFALFLVHSALNTEARKNFCQLLLKYLHFKNHTYQFSSVQLTSHVWLFATPWTVAHRASLSVTNSRSLVKPISLESVMPSNHLILCLSLLLLPSFFPTIRVFSSESVLHSRWPKYWSFRFSISPFNEYSGL